MLTAIPPLIIAILVGTIGLFVYSKNYKSSINTIFVLLCLSATWWLSFYSAMYLSRDPGKALFWARIGFIGIVFIPVFSYHFIVAFLKVKKQYPVVYLAYILTIPAIIFSRSRFIYKDISIHSWGYYPVAGPYYIIYLLMYGLLLSYGVWGLFKQLKMREFSELEHKQIRYLVVAFGISIFGIVDYIAKYPMFPFYPFGYLCAFMFISIIAYAIVRHKLMDIEVIIKKTLVFAGLLASVFTMLVLPTLLFQEYILRNAGMTGRLIGLTVSGIIIILTMRRIENFLINITDKYLFQKKYDYKELLKTFTAEVLTVLDLTKLVDLTVDKLVDIIKLSSSAVLLFNEERQEFRVVASRNIKDTSVTLLRPDGVVAFLDQTHGYILVKDLQEKKLSIPDSVQDIINKLNAELIIPMILQEKVMGILSLGKKKSDEDYTQDDLDILLPLARTLAIAISNAELFDELGKTQAEAAQKEKMAVIGTLSAGINHEICNPLGIARGQCEAFLLNIKDGLYKNKSTEELLEKSKDIMAKVIKETDRATAITKKLSGFAKPAKGEAELVNIDKEVDEVIGLVNYELKLEKIEVEKRISENLPNILVDKKQFQEVLFNLIRNAGQAIGEKGKITVWAREEAGKVFIDIQDTGSGIAEEKIKELFNPFFTTKDPGKGTGLGLFIVRQVVEKNGGRIYLKKTKVGEGTTFTVEFSLASKQEIKV